MKIKDYQENIFLILFALLSIPFFYGLILIKKCRRAEAEKSLKFLVIQTAKIGDLVCSTPVFRELKKKYPDSFLSILIIPQTKDVLKNNPYIDEVILLDREKYQSVGGIFRLSQEIAKKRFDWSFSLVPGILNTLIPLWSVIPHRVSTISKYDSRGTKILSILNSHRLEYQRSTLALRHYLNLLKFINIKEFSEEKEIFIGLEEKEKALQFLEKHNLKQGDFLVGISVTAGKKFKEWAPEKFAQLADRLIEELETEVVFVGALKDKEVIEGVQSSMKNKSLMMIEFNLIELAALLKEFSLFISVDTGSLYIADVVGVPVVDIAGPCQMKSQQPSGKFVIVQKKMACGPCSFIMSAPSYCKKGHLKCIEDTTVNDVFQAVEQLLGRKFL